MRVLVLYARAHARDRASAVICLEEGHPQNRGVAQNGEIRRPRNLTPDPDPKIETPDPARSLSYARARAIVRPRSMSWRMATPKIEDRPNLGPRKLTAPESGDPTPKIEDPQIWTPCKFACFFLSCARAVVCLEDGHAFCTHFRTPSAQTHSNGWPPKRTFNRKVAKRGRALPN